jgi:hypothetical protein
MPVATKRVKFGKVRLHERVGALSDISTLGQSDVHDAVVAQRDTTLGLAAQRMRQADGLIRCGFGDHIGEAIE